MWLLPSPREPKAPETSLTGDPCCGVDVAGSLLGTFRFDCLLELLETLLLFFLASWVFPTGLVLPFFDSPVILFRVSTWLLLTSAVLAFGLLSAVVGGLCKGLLLMLLLWLVAGVVAKWYSWLHVSWLWGGRELLLDFSAKWVSDRKRFKHDRKSKLYVLSWLNTSQVDQLCECT